MRKRVLYMLALLVVLTLFSGYLFYQRLVMQYNAEGNYFDEESAVVYNQQAVVVYGIITSLLFMLCCFSIWKLQYKKT